MYGGRIIDSFDRRISKVYMDEYFGDFLFDSFQPFHFYQDEGVDYVIPQVEDHSEFLDYIEQLPLANSPEVYGLNGNAEIGLFTETTKELWANLIELQPQTGNIARYVILLRAASNWRKIEFPLIKLFYPVGRAQLLPRPLELAEMNSSTTWRRIF